MAPRGNQHQIGLDVSLGQGGESRPLDETPFRLAILGDLSGRASRGQLATAGQLAASSPQRVDRDDLDEVLAAFAPALHLALAGSDSPKVVVRFRALEDFHPDSLIERVPLFLELNALRGRLADPRTFPDAAASLARNPDQLSARPPDRPNSSAEGEEFRVHHPSAGGGLLDAILGESSTDPEAALAESGGDLHRFIQKILRPHLVPRPDPRQADLLAEVDAALSATMRALLHHPDFLALEALWRGIDLLVRRIDTSSELQIHLIDLSAAELRLDLSSGKSVDIPAGVARLLKESSADQPWSLLAGCYTFGPDDEDLAQLGRLAALGRSLGAPWLSAASPALVGAASLLESADPRDWGAVPAPYWGALRHSLDARWLGLALPRYLVRLPYGKATESCERFAFEEWSDRSGHDEYCWGNPALLVALLHAAAFADRGWRMAEDIGVEVDGLPLHLKGADGATPVAEVLLTVKAAERIQEWGIMALASLKDQEAARFGRLQSVADPVAALAGRWGGGGAGAQ